MINGLIKIILVVLFDYRANNDYTTQVRVVISHQIHTDYMFYWKNVPQMNLVLNNIE